MLLKGTITQVETNGGLAWISRDSLFDASGNKQTISGQKSIFFNKWDSDFDELSIDTEVFFELVRQHKEGSSHRAVKVRPFVEGGILELHVDETTIENPSLPLRWCYTEAMHESMKIGTSKGYSYAVLLVLKHEDDSLGYSERREVKSAVHPFTFITFPKPGKWSVSLILYQRTSREVGRNNETLLMRAIAGRHLTKTSGHSSHYTNSVSTLITEGFFDNKYAVRVDGGGYPIAAGEILIEIPAGIFAPEPSAAVKDFANYFFRHKSPDECDLRRRLLIMTLGFGWVPWLVLQFLARLAHFVVSLGQLMFACRGSFTNLVKTFKPAIRFKESLMLPTEEELDGRVLYKPFHTKYGFWFTPILLLLYGAGLSGLYFGTRFLLSLLEKVPVTSGQIPMYGWIAPLVLGGIALVFYFRRPIAKAVEVEGNKLIDRIEVMQEQGAVKAAHVRAERLERHAPALVCGGDVVHEVSLKAVPRELRTFTMRFQQIKRTVCRPF